MNSASAFYARTMTVEQAVEQVRKDLFSLSGSEQLADSILEKEKMVHGGTISARNALSALNCYMMSYNIYSPEIVRDILRQIGDEPSPYYPNLDFTSTLAISPELKKARARSHLRLVPNEQ